MRPNKLQLISYGAGSINEDTAKLNSSSAWVLDGATGLNNNNIVDNESDAKWFVQQWNEYLSETMEKNHQSIKDVIKNGITMIKNKYYSAAEKSKPQPIDLPSSGIAIIRWDDEKLEYLILGDCILLIKHASNEVSVVKDDCLQELDEKVINHISQLMTEQKSSFEDAVQEANHMLVSNRLRKNTKEGYWILGFDEQAADQCIHDYADMKDVREIVIMSDGFAALIDKYHYTDENKIFDEINDKGLESLYKALRCIEQDDDEVLKYPRLKKKDDASAIAIRFY